MPHRLGDQRQLVDEGEDRGAATGGGVDAQLALAAGGDQADITLRGTEGGDGLCYCEGQFVPVVGQVQMDGAGGELQAL